MTHSDYPRLAILLATCLLLSSTLFIFLPEQACAASQGPLGPLQSRPTWIQDIIDTVQTTIIKVLQDTARMGGVLLWGLLKVCGMVGLFGNDFSALFGTVVTEALNTVVSGSLHNLLRGSLMVSLGLFGLSLLARPFWPDLRLVSFQRAAIWGIVLQAYLVSAPSIYAELETWRVNLSEEVASAVSSGAIPGCSGSVVEVLLCITGTSTAEVLDPELSHLPDHIAYGGSESVRDLYDHCVYNPPLLYGDPNCDPDNLLGDPWQVLVFAQDALGIQLLGLILGFLILAYGILQIALGLSAGMMFVLFPIAGIFAFYLPLEQFPAGVVRNYIGIFLKSVVLLTLAGVVIRLFSISTSSLAAMAAVGLVNLLLCFIMAKEALASLLGAVSFVGSSVAGLGAAFSLTGAGGAGSPSPGPESHAAASALTRNPTMQALMGAPRPLDRTEPTVMDAVGSALDSPRRAGRAFAGAAASAATGGAGLLVGAQAAAGGADYGSLALVGNAITSTFGPDAGRGFAVGAGAATARQVLRRSDGKDDYSDNDGDSGGSGQPPGGDNEPRLLVPPRQPRSPASGAPAATPAVTTGGDPALDAPPALAPVQTAIEGDSPDLNTWTPGSAQRIQDAGTRLAGASPAAQDSAVEVMEASHQTAQDWAAQGRSPTRSDGTLDSRFVDEVIEQVPQTAETFIREQADTGMPPDQRLALGEVIALGAATERTLSAPQVGRGFARAVQTMGPDGDLEGALHGQLGAGVRQVFGQRTPQARVVAAQMQRAGLANQEGRQLIEAVHESLAAQPHLSTRQFRQQQEHQAQPRLAGWDQATGAPEHTDRIVEGLIGLGTPAGTTVRDIPQVGTQPQAPGAPPTKVDAAPPVIDTPNTTAGTSNQTPSAPDTEPDPQLLVDLGTWRRETADRQGQKAFQVFSDATLERIAAARPQTLEELGAVKGVGPQKLAQYGPELLDFTRPASRAPNLDLEEPVAPLPNAPAGPSEVDLTSTSEPVPIVSEAVEPPTSPTEPQGLPSSPTTAEPSYDEALFQRLRTWRLMAAQQGNHKAFYVFTDDTLKRIAADQPTTLSELAAIRGVGPKKLEQYGSDVLRIVHQHPTQKGEQT